MTHRAWVVDKPGDIDRIQIRSLEEKNLQNDHIRIKVAYAGLNFADILAVLGLYSATPREPFTPGLEFSGIVSEIGSDVHDFKIGDRVMGVTRFGAYSEIVDIHPAYCDRLTEDWSFAEGAAYIAQAVTAWYALKELGNLKLHHKVLIHSAAGGVGLFAMHYVKALGGIPIGTVSSEKKIKFLNSLGYPHIYLRSPKLFDEIERDFGKNQIDLCLTAIGGEIQKKSYQALAPMGRLIVYGAAEYTPKGSRVNWIKTIYHYLRRPHFDPLNMIPENKSVMAFNIIWLWEYRSLLGQLLNEMSPYKVKPTLEKEVSFENAIEALHLLKSGRTIGKVVLKINSL